MKSIKGLAEIKCPNGCEEFESEFWSLVAADSAPELKDAVLGGELNLVCCPKCNHYFYYENNLIYLDPALNLLVFVFSEKEKNNQSSLKEKMHHDFEILKKSLSKEMNINGEPVYVFGLAALKELLEKDSVLAAESEVVAASSAVAGYKIITLRPDYARANNYPMYVPTKNSKEAADLYSAAEDVLAKGLNSKLLKKFAEDIKKGKTEPLFL
ncbi:hypothetical protein Emin_0641 [Elusimicrobium minutum Pei191]|uniref:CpXC domain-containing protein n=1 Tax=Elusimicrobium minutum (strain Pei191) TaxID=445932 RepID=B2KC69_ELUMP|nr:CpXC domain-containing protein [Elusimicrobium minutum]ACC98196.1 hypothetical protein Emin_0641 [Elusimicrobium minutum Pei191]